MKIIKGAIGLFKYFFGIGFVSNSIRNIRLNTCYKCPMCIKDLYFKKDKCSECGCYVYPKTALRSEYCPLDKW